MAMPVTTSMAAEEIDEPGHDEDAADEERGPASVEQLPHDPPP
jgi:hypothetical protein